MINKLNEHLRSKAEELLKISGLQLTLKIEEIPGELQAGYNKIDQTISINIRKIINNSRHELVEVSDYLEVIICHELGHAVDSILTSETLQNIASIRGSIYEILDILDSVQKNGELSLNIKKDLIDQVKLLEELEYPAEVRACNLGQRFVSNHLLKLYDEHSKKNLQAYKEDYKSLKELI